MSVWGNLVIVLLSFLNLFVLLALIKIFHKLWWIPTSIQNLMGSQGIKGPSYRFIHGSTKEILNMKKKAMNRPISLSHTTFSKVQPHIDSWIKLYGKNFLQWIGSQAQLVITEPELIKEILNDKDRVYSKANPQAFVKKIVGDSIVNSEGEKWVKLRKLSNYAFHAESLKGMIPAMISSVEMMLERWKLYDEEKEIEVFEEFRLLTSEAISKTAFGSSYIEGQNIFEMLMMLVKIASRNTYKLRLPGISKLFRSDDEIESEKIGKQMHSCIIEMIKKREANGKDDESFGSDFLGLLIKAHHDDANQNHDKLRLSVKDLVDECKTFYIAGQETTRTLLAWTIFLLAIHREWQEEARKEVLNLFGQKHPNPDGITKLKVMNMVINESLRLYPPVLGLTRKVEREVKLGKLRLPANLELYLPNIALHHDPQIWGEDVDHFKPERFSQGVAKATNNNAAAFFPFGMGPRNCVGANFATTEAKIALSMILQRYSFTLSPAYVHSPSEFLTLCPQHGIQVLIKSL